MARAAILALAIAVPAVGFQSAAPRRVARTARWADAVDAPEIGNGSDGPMSSASGRDGP